MGTKRNNSLITKTVTYTIREVVYDNGANDIICMTNQEYAGFKRRKGVLKSIISNRKLFTFSFTLKKNR